MTRPRVDDRDVVGELLGLVHVVRGEDDRDAVGAQVADEVPGGAAGLRVEAGGRLVQEDQLGAADHGHREREALLLAAGEPAVGRAAAAAEAEALDERVHVQRVGVQLGHVPEHLVGAGARVDAAGLEHHADPGAQLARPGVTGSRPRTRTVPESGLRYPSQVSTVVVLPAPFGPSTAVTPARATRSRPSTAVFVPYRFTRAWTWTTGSLRMGAESRYAGRPRYGRGGVPAVRSPGYTVLAGAVQRQPPLRVRHRVRHREQPGVGRAHPAPYDGSVPLEVGAQLVEAVGADRDLRDHLPAAVAATGRPTSHERGGYAVLGQVEAGAGVVARAEQEHPGAEGLQAGQRAALAEPAVGRVPVDDLGRARAERRERGLRMRAAQGAGPGADRLRDHADPAGGRDEGVVRGHGRPDRLPTTPRAPADCSTAAGSERSPVWVGTTSVPSGPSASSSPWTTATGPP